MLLTDYFRSHHDATWDIALQCGVRHGVIRLPEEESFNITDKDHWRSVYDNFMSYGLRPVAIEPMPNALHDHIKAGDAHRDECIDKVIKMFPIMHELEIKTICFNFMAHIGWLRTSSDVEERGGAHVTGFKMTDFIPVDKAITSEELWSSYSYFIKAVVPEAEKYGIRLALHPDDPPVPKLGDVARIMISKENIKKAVYDIMPSSSLGIAMCQANFFIMGEDLENVISEFADRIYMIHFRNVKGTPTDFRETFHDNGDIDMVKIMKCYIRSGINVPIRVDHVPTMAGEVSNLPGYDALGRLFAIGYMKGILDTCRE